jgi:hypothetical protein
MQTATATTGQAGQARWYPTSNFVPHRCATLIVDQSESSSLMTLKVPIAAGCSPSSQRMRTCWPEAVVDGGPIVDRARSPPAAGLAVFVRTFGGKQFGRQRPNAERNTAMIAAKKRLNIDQIDAQAAFELPVREMMLVTIVITNLLNNLSVDVDVKNNNVAVQVCAVVLLLNSQIGTSLTCDIAQ